MLIQMRVTKLFSGDEEKWMDESQRHLGDRKNKTCGLKRGVACICVCKCTCRIVVRSTKGRIEKINIELKDKATKETENMRININPEVSAFD